ncbi:MAG: threonyl-tRNA synthetase, threonyl-tRNA synthetase [Candidatus Peregrinibacteria bacterium GW2011_GWF2_43_17]|nr:MAG: threonyl-tRNA synthetase, threonyl-tRNA synthetase [Candidatus Peregrinibacteria bacterium GW2011_GWF2_43_17]HAU39318.1 threonine--tRNA ligase [Candidatus Peregrinibacteria bacterium]
MSKEKKTFPVETMRHSCSHILAQAVVQMFPEAKLAIGPDVENGFYYDFDLPRTLIPEDLALLEKKMRQIFKQTQKFAQKSLPVDEAISILHQSGQTYKVEMAEELKKQGENQISFYENIAQNGEVVFIDMCKGPHVEHSGQVGAFKLTSIAGAYWRGDEKNKMLQRIYGVCFATQAELDEHIKMVEEAKKRDHRKLGKELQLFAFDEDVGPGLPLWMPKGGALIEILENLAKKTEDRYGYVRVKTPHLAKESMYKKSGHLPYYQESMFPPMDVDGVKYYLKAMNCPHHHKIFAAVPRSYRELPLRLAEYGTCYRYEQTGELFGLMRVRSLQMNDAHIYCTEEQFEKEFQSVNEMYLEYFKIFGIEKYVMRFSTHDPKKLGEKFVDEPALWKKTEDMVRNVLIKTKTPFIEVPNEAAFYGPKIDVQVWSAIGKEFTLATNQVDFAVPRRFDLTFINEEGKSTTPLCIHRAPLGTHERFIGFLIEHYAGAFPAWLAPIQARILPVSEKFYPYAKEVFDDYKRAGFRVEIDDSDESLGKKIRDAEMQKIPYMLVVGEKEVEGKTVAVRDYATKKQDVMKTSEFAKVLGAGKKI